MHLALERPSLGGVSVRFEAAAPLFPTRRQTRFPLQFDGAEIRTASGAGDNFISFFFFVIAWIWPRFFTAHRRRVFGRSASITRHQQHIKVLNI